MSVWYMLGQLVGFGVILLVFGIVCYQVYKFIKNKLGGKYGEVKKGKEVRDKED